VLPGKLLSLVLQQSCTAASAVGALLTARVNLISIELLVQNVIPAVL
jgi:hypothetical protein